jgi:NTP pyrophosphatase (non-canonical NTP hydrolase)
MDFNEYQTKAKATDIYPKEVAFFCHALGLASEAGEVAGKIKKLYRDKNGLINTVDDIEIVKELGDVLWYLSRVAEDIGYDLEFIAAMNLEKLSDRKERNQLGGAGDHR